jgi:hypothetical protein
MNRRQKIVQQQFLNNEEEVIKELEKTYTTALEDVNERIRKLDLDIESTQMAIDMWEDFGGDEEKAILQSQLRSKIYQKRYQEALHGQIDDVLDKMNTKQFTTVAGYLNGCYDEGFIGTLYDLQGQGVPLIMPIDQESVVRAVQLDSKISGGLYSRMGEDVTKLKKAIASEVSRGIATGMSYDQVAKQISYKMVGTEYKDGGALARAKTIARTEGHRIQCQAGMDACYKAKDMGADVLKQWDATLDAKTRESHQQVDGEVRELDDKFSNGLMFPGDPSGGAAEVVNCRCALLQRARWALKENTDPDTGEVTWADDSFTKMDGRTGKLVTIDADGYDDFKKQYWSQINADKSSPTSKANSEQFERYRQVLGKNSPKTLEEFNEIKYNDPEKWDELKYQYRTVNRYEVDGNVSADKILELDNAAYYTKKKGFDYSGFSGKEKRKISNDISNGGNVATMELDGKVYFSHSKFDVSGSFEHSLYKGEYQAVTLSNNRIFKVKDLGDGIPRQYDTEAKLLEFVATQKKPTDKFTVTILSEKHICESCQGVVGQFKNMYPNATVNIVSGKKEYNGSPEGLHTWKRRKRVK